MCSKFSSFSLMGISNSEFFSDKDLNSMECNFLSRPALLQFQEGCQIEPLKEKEEEEEEVEIKKEDKYENLVSSLEIKLPLSLGEIKVKEEDEDGCRTPTSVEHTIPMVICPPAPRKPKSLPSRKRKARSSSSSCQRRILLDLSSEVESLFPPALLADPGKKIKKVRTEN